MTGALIEVRGLSKFYAPEGWSLRRKLPAGGGPSLVAALRGLNISFEAGEFTAIAGPSGSGKSTLLNLIGALDQPSEGDILYQGRSLSGLSVDELADFRLRHLGFIFQAYNLIPVLTAYENVEYPLALQGVPKEERWSRTMDALRAVGLESYADRRPALLSGGQQQRIAVARSIVHRPLVVLADEPTANLDSKTAGGLLDLMEGLNREQGVTFIFSSHDPAVLTRARRVAHIRDGRLVGGADESALL